ncbi:2-oxo acid dehydrogenase subunit E2 [Amycolatopsis thermoflava]|uniref:2-oxo acid dehydrogenase subunit E2 n=1 Tax=Amycolatopsis thermoflava TaxID=84480 RepID=UPI003F4A1F7D
MSDIKLIEIPKWGLSMEEGTVTAWRLAEGAGFRKGDLLCEVETSKITNEMEAPFDGVLRRVLARPGQTLPVGAPIAVSAPESVSDDEIERFLAQHGTGAQGDTAPVAANGDGASLADPVPARPAAPEPGPAGDTVVPPELRGRTGEDVFATPHARRLGRELGIDLAKVPGSGRDGRISVADVHAAVGAAGGRVAPAPAPPRPTVPGRSSQDDSAVPATPVARRLAARLGINLYDCRATGSRGRVCEADVREAERRFGLTAAPEVPAAPAESGTRVETVPLSPMRKEIGRRLQASKQTAPHFRVSVDLEIDELLALRERINATVPKVKLSVNDFLIKACAAALRRVPDVNVQFDESAQAVLRHSAADISVAVALPGGLVTPIVRAAEGKSLAEISAEVHSLVTKAKTGRLRPEEFQGGTFTISNLGMYGVTEFDAIINPPQGAILAVGAGRPCPVVAGGEVVVRTLLTATLSCDHRVIDGALGAEFLRELKRLVESPALMLV